MSRGREAREARRDALVAKAAADRERLADVLQPLAGMDRGLGQLRASGVLGPAGAITMGVTLSALLLAFPHSPVLRGLSAMLRLANSVGRVFSILRPGGRAA